MAEIITSALSLVTPKIQATFKIILYIYANHFIIPNRCHLHFCQNKTLGHAGDLNNKFNLVLNVLLL